MPGEDLVRMANQIALFFAPNPEDEAVDGVADHLRKFWTPAMRSELITLVDVAKDNGAVHALVEKAVQRMTTSRDA